MLMASELATTYRALAPDRTRIGCSCPDRTGVTGWHWRLFCQTNSLCSLRILNSSFSLSDPATWIEASTEPCCVSRNDADDACDGSGHQNRADVTRSGSCQSSLDVRDALTVDVTSRPWLAGSTTAAAAVGAAIGPVAIGFAVYLER